MDADGAAVSVKDVSKDDAGVSALTTADLQLVDKTTKSHMASGRFDGYFAQEKLTGYDYTTTVTGDEGIETTETVHVDVRYFIVEVTIQYHDGSYIPGSNSTDGYHKATYQILMERSDQEILDVTLDDLMAFQPIDNELDFVQLKSNDPADVRTNLSGDPVLDFEREWANYKVVLDYSDSYLWLEPIFGEDRTVTITAPDFLDQANRSPMTSGDK